MLPWNIYAQVAFTELELSCSIKTDWTLFILTGQYSACSNVHRRALRHKKNPKSFNCGSRPSCPVHQINSILTNIWSHSLASRKWTIWCTILHTSRQRPSWKETKLYFSSIWPYPSVCKGPVRRVIGRHVPDYKSPKEGRRKPLLKNHKWHLKKKLQTGVRKNFTNGWQSIAEIISRSLEFCVSLKLS